MRGFRVDWLYERSLSVAALALAIGFAGCGGSVGAGPDSGPGTGGSSGQGGAGAQASGGTGGTVSTGGTGGTAGLPRCAVATTTDAAVTDGAGNTVCNVFDITGAWLDPEPFTAGDDGGLRLDGGTLEEPSGGTILDGDYDLVRYQTSFTSRTRRTIRVFSGVTYIELASEQGDAADGGLNPVGSRVDLTVSRSDTWLAVVSVDCGTLGTKGYGYTVSGNDLTLFNIQGTSPTAGNVYTYRRTCAR